MQDGRRTRLVRVGLALLAAFCVAACAQPRSAAAPSASATDLLTRWDKALATGPTPPLIVTSQLEGQEGSWTNAEGGHNKLAVLSGRVTAGSGVPATAPKDVVVRLAGMPRTVQVISALAALHALAAAGSYDNSCDGDCSPVVLEGATLTMQKAATAAGPVVVPTWSFGVRGSKVRLTWVAVAPTSMAALPVLPNNLPAVSGVRYPLARVAKGQDVELSFTGTPPGPGPCGAEYTGAARASTRAVAITIQKIASTVQAQPGTACANAAAIRSVQVRLAEPLGVRILIDGGSGQVITLTG